MLVVRYAKQREVLAQALARAMQKLRRAQGTRVQSLAFREDSGVASRFQAHGNGARESSCLATPQKKLRKTRDSPEKQAVRTAHGHGARTAEGEQDLVARKESLLATAKAQVDDIMPMCALPITRPQWAAWLDANINEFHGRMKTASERRRALNTRVRARDNLPATAVRLQPTRVATASYKTQWAKHLSGRSGWHCLNTRTRKIMVLLMNNGCVT